MSKHDLNSVEAGAIGAMSGIIEVVLQQPSVSMKNAIQDRKPITLNPRVLYRGLVVNAGSIAPVSAIQFGVNASLEKRLSAPPTFVQQGVIAGVAGMVSGFASGPAELVMIQQQKTGLNLLRQLQMISSKHGTSTFFRGLVRLTSSFYHSHGRLVYILITPLISLVPFESELKIWRSQPPTVVREGFFTAAYLGANPTLQEKIHAASSFKDRPAMATVLAAVISGSTATFVTHPFDTMKTRMQANLSLPEYRNVISTAKTLFGEGGLRAFYSGFLPRLQRIVCAVFILGEAKTHLTDIYLKHCK